MKTVYISIINYNGTENTADCLRSLNDIDSKDLSISIYIIDNHSKKRFEIPKSLASKFPIEIIYNTENKGFSGGHNQVLKKAINNNIDYVLILNNDTFVDKNFLVSLCATLSLNNKIAAVGSKIYFAKGSEYHKNRYTSNQLGKVIWYGGGMMDWKNVLGSHRGVDEVDHGQYDLCEQTDFVSGCCMLLRVEALRKVGIFDESYFLYYEDNDLQKRLLNAGLVAFYDPKSIIWHKNASSAGGSGSGLQDYFISRNRLLFGMKYASLRSKIALLKESISLLWYGRPGQKQGVRDFYLMRFGKGSYIHD